MKKRDFISLKDLTPAEITRLLELAGQMKFDRTHSCELLKGKTLGLLFQKPSNRTRVSFEVGIFQMGGKSIYLGPEEINLGVREATSDVAKTVSRYLDGIVARTHSHEDILDLAKHASIPVINGLSDLFHPCQALADILTIQEKFKKLKGLTLAYVGDGNNVCHSLLMGCSKVGIHVNMAVPSGYEPNKEILQMAKTFAKESSARILLTHSPQEAVVDADVLYADVWVSMGQEAESEKRIKDFSGFQFNDNLAKFAKEHYIFMHCLPAHRGLEVTAEIIDGKHSVIFDQAENRLHTQKAVLNSLFHTW